MCVCVLLVNHFLDLRGKTNGRDNRILAERQHLHCGPQ